MYACRDYDQARRAYLNALKYAGENENILRDLSQLQIHLRDYPGYEDSRRKILMLKPSLISNWVHLAAATYVNRNYHGSLIAIESIIKFGEDDSMKIKMNEISEVILLAIRNHECLGQYQEGLELFEKHEKQIVDMVAKYDYKGRLHFKLGNAAEALKAYE